MKVGKKPAQDEQQSGDIESMLGSLLGGVAQQGMSSEEGQQGTDPVEAYLSAPEDVKNRVRATLGAKNDDDAVNMIQNDEGAAQMAMEILTKRKEPASMVEDLPQTATEDVMYPKRG